MKRIKMLAAAAIFCTAGFAGYAAYDRATMTDEEKLFQANLEALTNSEIVTGVVIECYDFGSIQCPTSTDEVKTIVTSTIVTEVN